MKSFIDIYEQTKNLFAAGGVVKQLRAWWFVPYKVRNEADAWDDVTPEWL